MADPGRHPDPNATGALTPLAGDRPGGKAREAHERDAAAARAVTAALDTAVGPPSAAEWLARLSSDRLFTTLARSDDTA